MSIEELFCNVDDFCKDFIPKWKKHLIKSGSIKRNRSCRMGLSEIMTLVILFHQSHYRDFKTYYTQYVMRYYREAFPGLVSYSRFVELKQSALIPLCGYLTSSFVQSRGIAFIDSTKIQVCHNKRINRNQVFKETACIGKSTMGWFYGFKLHLILNDKGEIISVKLTAGNIDDRKVVNEMTDTLTGKLFADKGYISQSLSQQLQQKGIQLVTSIRKNMKPKLVSLFDKLLLRKRSIIETVNDQLKNISQIEHTRHRSLKNFLVNMIAGLIAYTKQPKKPSIKIDFLKHQSLMLI